MIWPLLARFTRTRPETWPVDPVARSLAASDERRRSGHYPEAFSAEAGRRLLLAQLEASSWILRRVEKIDLTAEQAVRRRITLELLVPADAPVFVDRDRRRLRCVPLSLMLRRTLIGLDIRDEQNRSVSLPGLRLTQALDQSLLLAAASAGLSDADGHLSADLRHWVQRAVCGEIEEVRAAYEELNGPAGTAMLEATDVALFKATAQRMRHNFTLFVFLDEKDGQHRILRIAYDEPTDWRYQQPKLEPRHPDEPRGSWYYEPGTPQRTWRGLMARLGLMSTRMRFQVPGAESSASFHFELSAPPAVQIVEAILLAGRPNCPPARRLSFDHVRGHTPTVGLHAVEVPPGSLCRIQADFRVTARGWLTTMTVGTFAIAALMLTTLVHARHRSELGEPAITNAVVLLVTAVAAVAALVAQRDYVGMAARFVTWVRGLVTVALGLPIVTAGFLVFGKEPRLFGDEAAYRSILGLTVVAWLIFVLTATAWAQSWWRERRRMVQESPWDMSRPTAQTGGLRPPGIGEPYVDVARRFGFLQPAVGVASAEGWQNVYDWDDDKQEDAVTSLRRRR